MGISKQMHEDMTYGHEILSLHELNERRKAAEASSKIPSHYDNSKGSLYKVANERGWNPYVTEIVKRIERAEKKGEFISDIEKTIVVFLFYRFIITLLCLNFYNQSLHINYFSTLKIQ